MAQGITAISFCPEITRLTNFNFPAPPVIEFTTAGDIEAQVAPIRKDVEYLERRDYHSDNEESTYRITLRYNRF